MTRSLLLVLPIAAWAAASYASAETPPVTYESLLREMVDRGAIARFPDPAYSCKQFSSYDRKSDAGPDSGEWFANADRGQYVRTEENGGRKEWVLLDADGPGAIVRFWSANPSDKITIRYYLDGSAEPALAIPFTDLLGGTWRVGAPLSAIRAKGWNLYLPIPYAKHCKVTADGDDFYYQLNYRTYEAGTSVETFTMDAFDAARPVLRDVSEQLAQVGRENQLPRRPEIHRVLRLVDGGLTEVMLPAGSHAIRRLSVRWIPDDASDADGVRKQAEQIHRRTVLSLRFDGDETAWAPLGDFFGSGVGINPFRSWWQTVEADGTMTCYWPMPYRASASLSLLNHSGVAARFELTIEFGDWTWDDRSMHFHSAWRHEYPISTATKQDWNFVEVTGQGVYAGDALALVNPTTVWWGEGDEKIYVDGEKFPSHFGTGTEDYYGYAWGYWKFFEAPFHAQPRCDGPIVLGNTTVLRSRSLDAIPFRRSLKFDMEVWHWRTVDMDYAATTWFYARPGATDNRAADRKADELFVTPTRPPLKLEGALEGEEMEIVSLPPGTDWKYEGNWWNADWSGDAQIWLGCRHVGDAVELRPSRSLEAGKYRVIFRGSRYPDYGIIQVSVNGEKVGEPIDLHNKEKTLAATGPIDLGAVTLAAGAPTFRFAVVGSNPETPKPGTFIGIDCVVLKPAAD